jgi:hypothetical protein
VGRIGGQMLVLVLLMTDRKIRRESLNVTVPFRAVLWGAGSRSSGDALAPLTC